MTNFSFSESYSIVKGDQGEDFLDLSVSKIYEHQSYFDTLVFTIHTITAQESGHIDLITINIYGSYDYWWILLYTNDIENPIVDLVVGKTLKVYKRSDIDVFRSLVLKKVREKDIGIVELP